MEPDVRQELLEWCRTVADEILEDGGDVDELAFEAVDGSEWVIYYSKAAQVIEQANSDEVENAYAAAVETGMPDSYGRLQVSMAFEIMRDMLAAEFAGRG